MTEPTAPPQHRYRQLADRLARQIDDGHFAPGTAMPPERALAATEGVSRVTVRKAMEQLRLRGLVEQRRGSGTFVTRRVSQPLSVLTSFSDDVAARGMVAASRLLNCGVGRATPEETIALGLAPGHPVTRIARLRSADGQPLAVEAATVLNAAMPDPVLIADSLYLTLDRTGMRPVRAVQRLSAIALDDRTAGLLQVAAGAPGLLIARVGYTADDRRVEFTRSTFRGDRWDFVTELT